MMVASALRRQLRSLWPVMLLIYTPVVITLGMVVAVRIGTGTAIANLTRDPLQVVSAPFYIGIVSTAGALIWSATAAVCIFSYVVIRHRAARRAHARFLLAGGLVTVLLLLDDVFMFHEMVFPQHLGVPEKVVYAATAGVVLWFLVAFRSTILQTDFLLLALACAAFSFTVGADFIEPIFPYPAFYLLEDGAKLFGIVSWAAYFIMFSYGNLAEDRSSGV